MGGEVRASGSRTGGAAPGVGGEARRDGAPQEGGSRTRGLCGLELCLSFILMQNFSSGLCDKTTAWIG